MLAAGLTRRILLALLGSGLAGAFQERKDWVCPMDPDYRSSKPGICPRCGMTLVANIPERLDYRLEITQSPDFVKPGDLVTLTLCVVHPITLARVSQFEIVHEKLIHLFIVSENLEVFAHVHPLLQSDGSFSYQAKLPYPGMYRLLADFYPAGSVPQLAVGTLLVTGISQSVIPRASLAPKTAENLRVSLHLEPEQPIAGLESKLFFTLTPQEGLEPYLGAWAHMLCASSDLIDLLHLHPAYGMKQGTVQFNLIFPRPKTYRLWTQFQRQGVVNTVMFTIPVRNL